MTRLLEELQRPYGRDHYELVRAGRDDGVYWQSANGLIVRLAAAETVPEAHRIAQGLLDLAIRYATGR